MLLNTKQIAFRLGMLRNRPSAPSYRFTSRHGPNDGNYCLQRRKTNGHATKIADGFPSRYEGEFSLDEPQTTRAVNGSE